MTFFLRIEKNEEKRYKYKMLKLEMHKLQVGPFNIGISVLIPLHQFVHKKKRNSPLRN